MQAPVRNEKCVALFAKLSEYLDRELSAEDCREIEAHIEGCPPCVAFAQSLRRTVGLCREYEPEEAPGPLRDEARAELQTAYARMMKR